MRNDKLDFGWMNKSTSRMDGRDGVGKIGEKMGAIRRGRLGQERFGGLEIGAAGVCEDGADNTL